MNKSESIEISSDGQILQFGQNPEKTVDNLRGLGLLECLNPVTGMTPLLFICKLNKETIATQLIQAKADINAVTQGDEAQSCLQIAAKHHGSILLQLIGARADVNYIGKTALIIASQCGIYDNVRDLLYAGSNPNIGEYSCLYYSTKFKASSNINEILIQYKASGHGVITLDLSNLGLTKLTKDEEYWKTFNQLQEIDLRNNNLNFLPISLALLPNLKYVYLENNPLLSIPESVRNDFWSQKLKQYLLSVRQVSEDFLERKIVLLGPKGVGKSNVLYNLHNLKNSSDDITSDDSLTVEENFNLTKQIRYFKLLTSSQKSKFQFTSWDFGSNEGNLFPSYKFFLNSQAIYLIVFNLASPNFEQIEYWMNVIKSLTQNRNISPIILVGTNIDSPLCKDKEYCQNILLKFKNRFPRLKYPGMRGTYLVSNKTCQGISELKSKIIQVAEKITISVPPSWILFQKLLKQQTENYISWSIFQKMADEFAIDEECELKQVIEFLQDVGCILYFDDNRSNLRDFVILNPKWLASIMSKFYKNEKTQKIFEMNQISNILNEYPIFLHDTLLCLMEKFEIILRVPKKDKIIIPSLLPIDPPKSMLQTSPISSIITISNGYWSFNYPPQTIEHARIYEFSFLPVGLFDKMLSASFYLKNGISHIDFWRNGFLLALQEDLSCCYVKYTHKRDKQTENLIYILSIYTRMPKSRFIKGKPNILLNEMIKLVEHIIDSFYFQLSNEINRYIPCPHCTRTQKRFTEPYLFTLDECVHNLAENEPIVYCNNFHVPQRAVLISYLAPDITFRGFTILSEIDLGKKEDWIYLAKGGFGNVYKTFYRNNPVAVKELHNSESEIINNFTEFQREVQIMSVLTHDNTVDMIGISTNPLLIVTEFVGGGDLHRLLRPKNKNIYKPLSLDLQYRIAYDIAKGMAYLQSFNPPIVHRDLRSPNIFIVSDDPSANVCAKVADFGLSAFVVKDVGGALRTWQWLAPEVIDMDSSSYSELSDIYSYAIVLWEIITTKMPFFEYYDNPKYSRTIKRTDGEIEYVTDIHAIQSAIVHDNLRPTIPNDCPSEFKEIIETCWNNDASRRYSFESILKILKPFVTINKSSKIQKRKLKTSSFSAKTPDLENSDEREQLVLSKIKSEEKIPKSNQITIGSEIYCMLVIDKRLWVATTSDIKLFALTDIYNTQLTEMNSIISWNHEHNRVYSMIKLNNSPKVWTAGGHGLIQVWSAYTGKLLWKKEFKGMISSIREVNYNSISYVWIAIPELNIIHRINSETYQELKPIVLGEFPCFSMISHKDYIFVGSRGVIIILDCNGEILGTWEAHENLAIRFIESKPPILWTGAGREICIWDIQLPKSIEDSIEINPITRVQAHDTRITAMQLLNMKDNITNEIKEEIWTSSYDYNVLTWLFDCKSFEPYFEIKLPEKEFIRSFIQYDNIVFMGSSIRDSNGNVDGNIFIYKFNYTINK